jgi:hypothetical protein
VFAKNAHDTRLTLTIAFLLPTNERDTRYLGDEPHPVTGKSWGDVRFAEDSHKPLDDLIKSIIKKEQPQVVPCPWLCVRACVCACVCVRVCVCACECACHTHLHTLTAHPPYHRYQRLVIKKEDLLKMFEYNRFKQRLISTREGMDVTTVYVLLPSLRLSVSADQGRPTLAHTHQSGRQVHGLVNITLA